MKESRSVGEETYDRCPQRRDCTFLHVKNRSLENIDEDTEKRRDIICQTDKLRIRIRRDADDEKMGITTSESLMI